MMTVMPILGAIVISAAFNFSSIICLTKTPDYSLCHIMTSNRSKSLQTNVSMLTVTNYLRSQASQAIQTVTAQNIIQIISTHTIITVILMIQMMIPMALQRILIHDSEISAELDLHPVNFWPKPMTMQDVFNMSVAYESPGKVYSHAKDPNFEVGRIKPWLLDILCIAYLFADHGMSAAMPAN